MLKNRVVITQMGLVSNNSQNSNDFGINCMKGYVGIKQCDFFDESIKNQEISETDRSRCLESGPPAPALPRTTEPETR